MSHITSYDPNMRWAMHTIEFTFMQWDYSIKLKQDICGNCKGAYLFRSAMQSLFEDLPSATIFLKRPAEDGNGEDSLEVTLEDEDELSELCVSASIVEHLEEKRT